MQSIRYYAVVFLAALGLSLACVPAQAAGADDAGKYIQDVGNSALGVITSKNHTKQQKQDELQKVFANSVDFQWVGRFVLGRYWREATEAQRARYLTEYQKFLLLHYTSRFTDYTSGSFKVTASRDDGDGEYTVSTQMQSGEVSNGDPVLVDYRVRKGDNGTFKIFDVIVEGVSLLTTQRSEFSSVISNKGLDYLINQLASKSVADIKPSAGRASSR